MTSPEPSEKRISQRAITVEEEDDGAAQRVEAELLACDGDEHVERASQIDGVDGGVERTRGGQQDHRAPIAAGHAPRVCGESVTGKRSSRPSGKATSQGVAVSTVRGTRRGGSTGDRSRHRQR